MLSGQAPQADVSALYQRTRVKLLADLKSLARYTCVQTITRAYRQPARKGLSLPCRSLLANRERRAREPLTAWDRLRVDVTVASEKEIYTWAGAPRFQGSLFDVVGRFGRPLADGDFSGYLAGILENSARVVPHGTQIKNGRILVQIDYEVPLFASRYAIATPTRAWTTAYSGSLLLDPDTGDLVKGSLASSELPPETEQCAAFQDVEYARVEIGGKSVLIPSATRLTIIDREGGESVNSSSYAGCRAYTGQSSIRFDEAVDGDPSTAGAGIEAPPLALPPESEFRVRILTRIDSNSFAAAIP